LDALLDGQQSVEVLKSHQLRSRMSEFPIIVISDWDTLEADIVRELKDYVFKGGKLLIVGGASTGYFADILGVIPNGSPIKVSKPLGFKGRFANIEGTLHKITPLPGTNERAHLFSSTDTRYPAELVATTRQYGAGN